MCAPTGPIQLRAGPDEGGAAETLKARWFELDTGHYPMLTAPKALAGMIMN